MDLLPVVEETIQRHGLLECGDRVLVGLSGGPDSVCLLDLLRRLADPWNLTLFAMHVHHGLRESADADAQFCVELAAEWNIPLSVANVDVPAVIGETGESIEEAARRLRYSQLKSHAGVIGASRIAVGHHKNDQAETVLMNVIRGAGLRGLRGMLPENGQVIRPLLAVDRTQIEDYCAWRDLVTRVDPTNYETDYLRNRIRLKLLPFIEHDFNPKVIEALSKLADVVQEEYVVLETRTKHLVRDVATNNDRGPEVITEAFNALSQGDRRRIVRALYRRVLDDPGELGYTHVNSVLELAEGGNVHKQLDLPGGVLVRKTCDALQFMVNGEDEPSPCFERNVRVPGETYLPEIGATLRTSVKERAEVSSAVTTNCLVERAYFDYNKIVLPLRARNRRSGDHFRPLGMTGSKKLKDFFIDEKVPRKLRGRIPIILTGETIIWVAGYRVSEMARVTPETRTVLVIDLVDGNVHASGKQPAGPGERGL